MTLPLAKEGLPAELWGQREGQVESRAVVRVERRGVKFCQPQHRSDLRLSSILTMNPRKLISTSASQKGHPEHLLPCLGYVAGP